MIRTIAVTRALVAFCIIIALSGARGLCGGMAPLPLHDLTNRADAIVVGEVRQGTATYDRIVGTLVIAHVIKGDFKTGDVVSFEAVVGPEAAKGTPQPGKEFGLFFLLRSTTGPWTVKPPISGYLMDFESAFVPLPRNPKSVGLPVDVQASTLDRVIVEVTSVLEGDNPRIPTDIVGEYRKNASPALKSMFAKLRSDPNPRLKLVALRARAVEADDDALTDVDRELPTLGPDAIGAISQDVQFYFANRSATAVGKLGKIAASPSADKRFRFAATAALARLHTQQSLPFLVGLLDDSDPRVRATVVGGIAMFANNVPPGKHQPAPGDWKYRTDGTIRNSIADENLLQNTPGVIGFWKSWWAQNKSDFGY